MKNNNRSVKFIAGATAGVLMLCYIIYSQAINTLSNESNIKQTNIIGQKINFDELEMQNTSHRLNIIDVKKKKIVFFLSPTCPHCINAIKSLRKVRDLFVNKVDFYPVFKSSANQEVINDLLREQRVKYPIFIHNSESNISYIKLIPTLALLDEKGIIIRYRIGGFETESSLYSIINSFVNESSWGKDTSSAKLSACSS